MKAGRFTTFFQAIGASGSESIEFTGTEPKKVILVPSAAGLHILLTSSTSVVNADAEDLLLPSSGLEVETGRSLDRLSVYNSSGGSVNIHVAVLD